MYCHISRVRPWLGLFVRLPPGSGGAFGFFGCPLFCLVWLFACPLAFAFVFGFACLWLVCLFLRVLVCIHTVDAEAVKVSARRLTSRTVSLQRWKQPGGPGGAGG